MSRFCPLYSGSSGNCTYIGSGGSGILIDAGVSAKGICSMLESIEVDPQTIAAIFITHEHSDHIGGLRVLAGRKKIPVFASLETVESLIRGGKVDERVDIQPMDDSLVIGDMEISRFSTSHDCAGSSGYTVSISDGRKMAVCTDLGYVGDEVRAALTGCDLILMESNHDVMMLQNGPYPYYLKRRILGERGHLSNNGCAAELPDFIRAGATRFVLGHLSRENNYPELALASARAVLGECGMKEDLDYIISVAPPAGGRVVAL